MFYAICFIAVSVVFRIIFSFEVHGAENLRQYKKNGRPFLVCSNHLSMLDPVFIVMAYGVGRKLSIMGKAELFRNPVLAYLFKCVGVFPVERGKADKSALEKGISDIKNGHGMLIFPEGTRGTGDEMLKIKSGAFMIARQTGADIIPVRVIYPTSTRKLKFFGKVVLNFGQPMLAEDMNLTSGSRQAIRETKAKLEAAFASLLKQYNDSVGYIPPVKTEEMPENEEQNIVTEKENNVLQSEENPVTEAKNG